ncbi:MAG: hypothetical protein JNK35_05665 [Phycisphaerae bacterium]|nr:hypothetical protein [Phycisphaerae bacterium]
MDEHGEGAGRDQEVEAGGAAESGVAGAREVVTGKQLCNGCGYALVGLPVDGVCPECGRSVAASLAGDDLRFAPPEYLRSLERGARWVQWSLVLKVLTIIAGIALGIALMAAGVAGQRWISTVVTGGLGLGAAAASALGWWWLSAPDPSRRAGDKGESPRRLVRVTLVLVVVGSLASSAGEVVQSVMGPVPVFGPGGTIRGGGGGGTGAGTTATATTLGVGVVGLALGALALVGNLAWIVQYFAAMTYLAWLAPRIPDEQAVRDAKRLMWLGPVLYVLLACVLMIGPLIATVMYFVLLDRVREGVRRVRVMAEAEDWARMAGATGAVARGL